jgi:hypothetical protein
LRRETVGAYDKGKAGLVLEEQTLLVDASTDEVYTKMVGSAFFVGQVNLQCKMADFREVMMAQRDQKNQVIKRQVGRNRTTLRNFRRAPVKHCCID